MYYSERQAYHAQPIARRRRRLVAIGVVILAAVAVGLHQRAAGQVDPQTVTVERMRAIEEALDRYAVDNGGAIPTSEQRLQALVEPPKIAPRPRNWTGPYVSEECLADGWGYELHYVSPGGGDPKRPYDLWSLGSDDTDGGVETAADIKSWEPKTQTL